MTCVHNANTTLKLFDTALLASICLSYFCKSRFSTRFHGSGDGVSHVSVHLRLCSQMNRRRARIEYPCVYCRLWVHRKCVTPTTLSTIFFHIFCDCKFHFHYSYRVFFSRVIEQRGHDRLKHDNRQKGSSDCTLLGHTRRIHAYVFISFRLLCFFSVIFFSLVSTIRDKVI